MTLAPLSRRALLAAPAAAWARPPRMKIAVMDGVLGLSGKPAAVALAKELGFDGLQVTLSSLTPATIDAFRRASRTHRLPLVATYLDILHQHCLKTDPQALSDVRAAIETTRQLGAPICMTVFFGQCAIQNQAEEDAVAQALRTLAPAAARARVTLGFENLLTAAAGLRVLAQVKSSALKVYYDIGNATNMVGVQPAAEIRALGRARLCQVHVKDKGYLGEGKVDIRAALLALRDIGYSGYLVLETSSPSRDRAADLRRNLAYLKNLLQELSA